MAIHVVNNEIVGNCTWTRPEIISYCTYMAGYADMRMQATAIFSQVCKSFSIPFGILSNILLLFTLQSSVLSGTTFDYLRIISVLQLIKTVLSIGSSEFVDAFTPYVDAIPSFSVAWKCALFHLMIPSLMDLCRLMACLLSFFLLLERFLAVAVPHKFSKMDTKKFYRASSVLSFLVSCLELARIAEISIEQPNDQAAQNSWFGEHAIYYTYLKPLIITIKATVVIFMIIFGLVIVGRLRHRSRQIVKMSSGETAAKEFQDTMSLARFQIVDTIVMIIEVGWTVVADVTISVLNTSINRQDDTPCDYRVKMAQVLGYRICGIFLPYSTNMMQSLGHGELFFIYLACFKKFRRGFLDMCRKVYMKAGKFRKGANGVVNVVIVSSAH